MTNKPRFSLCVLSATRLLLNQQVNSLHTEVQALDLGRPVIFDTVENYCRLTGASLYQFTNHNALSDGCTITNGEHYVVLYNDMRCVSHERLNWTLAHEVGHICLGHTCDGDIEEIEANFFAAELLMPEIILRSIASRQRLTCWDVQELFHVSSIAAQRRIQTLQNKRYYSPGREDRLLFQKYSPLLQKIH